MSRRGTLKERNARRTERLASLPLSAAQKKLDAAAEVRATKRAEARAANRGKRNPSPLDEPDRRLSAINYAVMAEFEEFDIDPKETGAIMAHVFSAYPLSVSAIERNGKMFLSVFADFSSRPNMKQSKSRRLSFASKSTTAIETFIAKNGRVWSRCRPSEYAEIIHAATIVQRIIAGVRHGDLLDAAAALFALGPPWADLLQFFVERGKGLTIDKTRAPPLTAKVMLFLQMAQCVFESYERQSRKALNELSTGLFPGGSATEIMLTKNGQ